MSHFTVLVIGDNPEGQLRPYQENNMGDCPEEFLEFNDVENEYREAFENGTTTKVIMPDGRKLSPWDDEFRVSGSIGTGTNTHKVPSNLEQKEIPLKDIYNTFDKYMEEYCGYEKNSNDKYGYYENPNAKWDWYTIGGRWSGFFKTKEGDRDQCLKKDIDIDFMRNKSKQKAKKQYAVASAVIDNENFEPWESVMNRFEKIGEARTFYHNQPVRKRWNASNEVKESIGYFSSPDDFMMSEEEFVDKHEFSDIITFAVIKDGKWYEKGSMGWWGSVSNENKEWNKEFIKLFDSIPGDTLLTLVDCHI